MLKLFSEDRTYFKVECTSNLRLKADFLLTDRCACVHSFGIFQKDNVTAVF